MYRRECLLSVVCLSSKCGKIKENWPGPAPIPTNEDKYIVNTQTGQGKVSCEGSVQI